MSTGWRSVAAVSGKGHLDQDDEGPGLPEPGGETAADLRHVGTGPRGQWHPEDDLLEVDQDQGGGGRVELNHQHSLQGKWPEGQSGLDERSVPFNLVEGRLK